MKDFNLIMEQFKSKHSEIDSQDYLEKYINFLISYEAKVFEEYSERHHILPRSTFPEFENDKWNIVNLKYEDHRLVHLWLFKSVNERVYQKPLNFMNKEYKNSEELSKATKKGWIKLKNNKEKYEKWCKEKSENMKEFRNSEKYKERMIKYFNNPNYGEFKKRESKNWGDRYSSENQRRRANIFWANITDEDYLNFCNKMKNYWTEDKKIEKSKQMNEYYSNIENVEKKRKETQDRWDSMNEEYRLKFKEKMDKINKDESKRIDASNKIKKKWEDPEYLEKMKSRTKNAGKKIKLVKINGEQEIFENMRVMTDKYGFSAHLIRKYRDTGNRILEKDLNQENTILLNCIIESI
jgi:hypothetical protein